MAKRKYRVIRLPERPRRAVAEQDVGYGLRLLAWLVRSYDLGLLDQLDQGELTDDDRGILRTILSQLLRTTERYRALGVVWTWLGFGDVPATDAGD